MKPLPAAFFREASQTDRVAFTAHVLVIAALICGFLYYGRDILIPVALAVLIAFLMTPPIKRLQKSGAPKTAAILAIVIVVSAVVASLGMLVSRQVSTLSEQLPAYETNLREKVKSLREITQGESVFGGAGDMLNRLGAELEAKPAQATSVNIGTTREVAVLTSQPGFFDPYLNVVGPLLHPAVQTMLVVIFLVFFLFQREDLRDRLIRLAGRGDLVKSTAAMNDAGSKIASLFMMQALVNASFGVFIGVSLWFLGVPAAALWGVFAALMRFVPYVGAILSAIFPVLLAAAISPDWTLPLLVFGLFAVSEPIIGHVIEPLVFGHTAGLSPVAVIASAAFWTALWGPVGLLLSTPLTICLAVIGRHVEGLGFLEVLFGSQPALTPSQSLYQRLLARDTAEASAMSERWLFDGTMSSYLNEVALPALLLAENDRLQRNLTSEEQSTLASEFSEVLDTVFIPDGEVAGSTEDRAILLVPAPGSLNFAATVALSASLSSKGISHKMLGENASSPVSEDGRPAGDVKAFVLVNLIEPAAERAEFLRRRLNRKFGNTPMILASWFASNEPNSTARPDAGALDQITLQLQKHGHGTVVTNSNETQDVNGNQSDADTLT